MSLGSLHALKVRRGSRAATILDQRLRLARDHRTESAPPDHWPTGDDTRRGPPESDVPPRPTPHVLPASHPSRAAAAPRAAGMSSADRCRSRPVRRWSLVPSAPLNAPRAKVGSTGPGASSSPFPWSGTCAELRRIALYRICRSSSHASASRRLANTAISPAADTKYRATFSASGPWLTMAAGPRGPSDRAVCRRCMSSTSIASGTAVASYTNRYVQALSATCLLTTVISSWAVNGPSPMTTMRLRGLSSV